MAKLSGWEICTFCVTFLQFFIVTWSQNEPSENQEKNTQLTSTPWRVMGLHCLSWLNLKKLIIKGL